MEELLPTTLYYIRALNLGTAVGCMCRCPMVQCTQALLELGPEAYCIVYTHYRAATNCLPRGDTRKLPHSVPQKSDRPGPSAQQLGLERPATLID